MAGNFTGSTPFIVLWGTIVPREAILRNWNLASANGDNVVPIVDREGPQNIESDSLVADGILHIPNPRLSVLYSSEQSNVILSITENNTLD